MFKRMAALAAVGLLLWPGALAEPVPEEGISVENDETAQATNAPAETPVEEMETFELGGGEEPATLEESPLEVPEPEAAGMPYSAFGVDLTSRAYRKSNPLYQNGQAGGSAWYCWGRAYEKCGVKLYWNDGDLSNAARWLDDAGDWLNAGREAGFTLGDAPRADAIAVYGNGRLVFIESLDGSEAWITWINADSEYEERTLDLKAHPPKGYIYLRGRVAGGQCGDALYWNLYDDQTLEIYGSGPMWGYATSPWQGDGFDSVRRVSVCTGVTALGEAAFSGMSMRSVNLPETVSALGTGAFRDCGALRVVALPDGISSIPDAAFKGCVSLTRVDLPRSLKAIGDDAFRQTALESVALPDGTETLHAGAFAESALQAIGLPASIRVVDPLAFAGCPALSRITVGAGSAAFADRNDALYTRDGETLIFCAPHRSGSFEVPGGVRHIGSHAFDSSELTEIRLPEGLADIGDGAFEGALNLREMNLPGSISHIGAAFGDQKPANLTIEAAYGGYAHRYCRVQDRRYNQRGAVSRYVLSLAPGDGMTTAVLYAGEQLQLTLPRGSVAVPSDETSACAAVTDAGLITAHDTGDGQIAVYLPDGSMQSIHLSVSDPYTPRSVRLDGPEAVTLAMDRRMTLAAVLSPATARTALRWESSDWTVATVDDGGVVNPISEGVTWISVTTGNGLRAEVCLEVINPYKVREIELDRKGVVPLDLNETLQLNVTLSPASARTTLSWKSSNPHVATVSDGGLVTPVGKGMARITVTTANRLSTSVKVKVADLYTPVKVTLDQGGTLRLRVGESLSLTASVMPATAKTGFHWTTSDGQIVKGSNKGALATLVGNEPGTAIITVTTDNGKTAKVKIKVVK